MREINVLPCLLLALGIRDEQSRIQRLARTMLSIQALVHEPTGASSVTVGHKLGEVEPGFRDTVFGIDVASHERRTAASLFFEVHDVFADFPR